MLELLRFVKDLSMVVSDDSTLTSSIEKHAKASITGKAYIKEDYAALFYNYGPDDFHKVGKYLPGKAGPSDENSLPEAVSMVLKGRVLQVKEPVMGWRGPKKRASPSGPGLRAAAIF